MYQYIENPKRRTSKGRENTLITIGGMIGAGKTTITNILSEHLNFKPYHENVEGNDILPLFYTATPEEQELKRYPFLLQLEFLHSRFEMIKQALRTDQNVIMDRSIYEDWYFSKINQEIGNISSLEFKLYEKLLYNMLEELEELPKKSPDLMIYLKISFEKTLERISKRGREFEQDEELYDYYYKLWKSYDDWVMNHYDHSNVLIIDMDKVDIENNMQDQEEFIELVISKYSKLKG